MPKRYYARRRKSRIVTHKRMYIIIGSLAVVLTVGIILIAMALNGQPGNPNLPRNSAAVTSPKNSATKAPTKTVSPSPSASPSASLSPSASSAPAATLAADLAPHPTNNGKVNTDPSALNFTTDIKVGDDDAVSSDKSTYQRKDPISFGTGSEYTSIEGVITFRGNNYRNSPSWGTADIKEGKLAVLKKKQTGTLGAFGGGLAWTGQPLVVKWPDKTRKNMTTLYDQYKNKEGFTEVIIASLDGYLYFEDLDTGEKTRDPIKLGAPTKGTASLYPSGIPLLFVGQGLNPQGMAKPDNMYYRVVNLITGKVTKLWGYTTKDPFAYRGWQAYDSSALIDAKTDTLIEPGESGVLYTLKLNTKYDENAGTLTIDPEKPVKYRYTSAMNTSRDKLDKGRWGVENSLAAWRNYIFFTDNAGLLQCVDINTMKLVYANDLGNDSDVSMILEEDTSKNDFYLYTGCEYDHLVVNKAAGKGTCYARKIDGVTGEIIWEQPFTVASNDKVDGGIVANPVLGKAGTSIDGLVIYDVTYEIKDKSRTSELIAFNKETGDIVWRFDMNTPGWSPSSPVPVYNAGGQAYIIQCDYDGNVFLLKADATTCTKSYELPLAESKEINNNFEASPVVYGNTIVVGSRDQNIFLIKIS